MNQSSSAVFVCEAFGVPPPEISWTLPDGSVVQYNPEGSGDTVPNIYAETEPSSDSPYQIISRLYIQSASPEDEGTYTCTAANGVENLIGANDTASATLVVQGRYDTLCP